MIWRGINLIHLFLDCTRSVFYKHSDKTFGLHKVGGGEWGGGI
jgi:hypothetical protein